MAPAPSTAVDCSPRAAPHCAAAAIPPCKSCVREQRDRTPLKSGHWLIWSWRGLNHQICQNMQSLILEAGISFQHFPVQKANLIQPEAREWYPAITGNRILQVRSKQGKYTKSKADFTISRTWICRHYSKEQQPKLCPVFGKRRNKVKR